MTIPEPPPEPPTEEPPVPSRSSGSIAGRAAALGVVAVAAIASGLLVVRSGRVDSAATFVGIPLLLAGLIAVSPPAKSLHGLTFRVVTFTLLIASAFLHEGAACVLMAAPLVYGVAHLVAELVSQARRRTQRRMALAVVPLLLLTSLEGIAYRVDPEQTVSTERVVAMAPADVAQRIQRGPDFSVPRPFLLRFSGYPTPTAAAGTDLAVGTRWTFTMAGGPIVTEVRHRDAQRIEFAVVSDKSKATRWVRWQSGVISLTPLPGGGTSMRLEISFVRRLDPSWYFGPIEQAMVGAGLDHFADALIKSS